MFFLACADPDSDSKADSGLPDTDSATDSADTDSGTDSGTDSDSGTETDSDSGGTSTIGDGIWWFEDVFPVDLAPAGNLALVQSLVSLEGEIFFIDTTEMKLGSQTTLGDASKDLATGLSAGGVVSALHGVPVEAGIWSAATDWVDLPSPYAEGCDQDNGGAFDLSDDGSVVVGLMWEGCEPAAFRWTETTGVTPLERLGDGGGSLAVNRATVVSGDGQVTAGFAENNGLDRNPAWWSADGSGALLETGETELTGEVLAIDQDGSVMAGLLGYDGFVWDGAAVSLLGRLEGYLATDGVYPNALSYDGSLAFGAMGDEFFSVPSAFVWSEDEGMRALQPLVEAAGIDLEGHTLTNVLAVSDDGAVLLGRAYDADFEIETFVLRIDPDAYGG